MDLFLHSSQLIFLVSEKEVTSQKVASEQSDQREAVLSREKVDQEVKVDLEEGEGEVEVVEGVVVVVVELVVVLVVGKENLSVTVVVTGRE